MNRTVKSGVAVIAGLLMSGPSMAAECSGYDVLVSQSGETYEAGKGHTLTVFRSYSIVISENSIYNLTTGECSGTVLALPDGKMRMNGHCARKDKDGDTQSIEFGMAPGAEKGTWKSTGGTGKFAGKTDSGWFQGVVADGKMSASRWGGTCR